MNLSGLFNLQRRTLVKFIGLIGLAAGLGRVFSPEIFQPSRQSENDAKNRKSNWKGTRPWIGKDYWATPLSDWELFDGEVRVLGLKGRELQLLTTRIGGGDFEIVTKISLFTKGRTSDSKSSVGIQIRNDLRGESEQHPLGLGTAKSSIRCGITVSGDLFLNDKVSTVERTNLRGIVLKLKLDKAILSLTAFQGESAIGFIEMPFLSGDQVHGYLSFITSCADKTKREDAAVWSIHNWALSGDSLDDRSQFAYGPILWSQYSVDSGVLKLTAQIVPIGSNDSQSVGLELLVNGDWRLMASVEIDTYSRTGVFELNNWVENTDVKYRVSYFNEGEKYTWGGVIRGLPSNVENLRIAAFSCDKGYAFPLAEMVSEVISQNPDMVMFLGDQIYEGYGGTVPLRTRDPDLLDASVLDYLGKYYRFGLTWRNVLKDRPSIIITDDHDVYQGNIYGMGGEPQDPKYLGQHWRGGYLMPPQWVNAVQRTQTGHLPSPVDRKPVAQGIDVYFTEMNYGGIPIAILEDRKWKSGTGSKQAKTDPQLLGERQEGFLRGWASRTAGSPIRLVVTQTAFASPVTHVQGAKQKGGWEDTNGWPKSKRDETLSIFAGTPTLMLHGDLHLGVLLRYGIKDFNDGPLGLVVPGTTNGFQRAWWPDQDAANEEPLDAPNYTGEFLDPLKNMMSIMGVANPTKGSHSLPIEQIGPDAYAHAKGSGYASISIDMRDQSLGINMWQFPIKGKLAQQFDGFPQKIKFQEFQTTAPALGN